MDLGTVTPRHVPQKTKLAGKGIGFDGFALDEAGVTHGGFLARGLPIYQRDIETALLKVQGGAGTNHACA
jgi:hypothetical protein